MWKLELEDEYFRIYDSKKQIAGYFDPDYGQVFPFHKEDEIIEKMLKNHDNITGGLLMVPMVKFGIFDSDYESSITELEKQIQFAEERIHKWKEFISLTKHDTHFIRLSHTDQDMLSITFPIKFSKPIPLYEKAILAELNPILDQMQKLGLL